MQYVVAVDGGNTKTIAFVARLDGEIVGAGRAGCGDIYGAVNAEAAFQAVEDAVEAALAMAGAKRDDLLAGGFSMAGADWPEDFDFIRDAMVERRFGKMVVVVNDAIGALRAGSPDGSGVVVVCGTGTATGARTLDGRVWHTSFWQGPHGAVDLGHQALRAIYRTDLGLDPPTRLTARILDFYGFETVEQVLHRYTYRMGERLSAGPLARILLDEAERGDTTARRLVIEHGTALGDYADVAARKVGLQGTEFALVLAGGVLRNPSRLLAQALIERVQIASPQAKPLMIRLEPIAGALFLALEAAGVDVDEQVHQRLLASLPPAALWHT